MKLVGIAAAAAAACVMAAAAFAEEVNLLASYGSANWQGDSLALDSASGAVYFGSGSGAEQSAVLEIKAEGAGIYFYVDAGNGVNTNDSGYCTVEFCGEDGEALFLASTGSIRGLENYSRFYFGSEEKYYPLPEETEKIVVSLHAEGNSDRANVYFRNFTLFMSSDKPLMEPENFLNIEEPVYYMSSVAGLTRVEAGINPWVRWVWIGVVFAVSMVFYFVRIMKDKYKTAEVMKAGKRKN